MEYYIYYGTGAGNGIVHGSLEDAKAYADKGACYTQTDIRICNVRGELVAERSWWGFGLGGIEENCDPIQFGDYGYYGDWYDG